MLKALYITSACLFLVLSQPGQGQESADSPIKSLEEVLGFEPSTETATARKGGAAKGNSLVVQDEKSTFRLYRPVFEDAVYFFDEQIRTDRMGWITALCISPEEAKVSPAVVLLDGEFPFVRIPPNRPDELDLTEWEGRYLMRTPLAGYLLGAGYSVIIPEEKTLRRYRRIPSRDWANLLGKFKKLKWIDENSFFMVSTREFAELAFKLAGETEFTGVVVEEPSHMIFGNVEEQSQPVSTGRRAPAPLLIAQAPPEGTPPQLEGFTPEIARRYVGYLDRIQSPILMIMAKNSIYADFNSQTLLRVLSAVESDFRVIMLDEPARSRRPMRNETRNMTTK